MGASPAALPDRIGTGCRCYGNPSSNDKSAGNSQFLQVHLLIVRQPYSNHSGGASVTGVTVDGVAA